MKASLSGTQKDFVFLELVYTKTFLSKTQGKQSFLGFQKDFVFQGKGICNGNGRSYSSCYAREC